MAQIGQPKCLNCNEYFDCDPRNLIRLHHCSTPECCRSSKAAIRQHGWQNLKTRTTFVAPFMWPRCRTGVWLIRATAAPNPRHHYRYKIPYPFNQLIQLKNPLFVLSYLNPKSTWRYKMSYPFNQLIQLRNPLFVLSYLNPKPT